MHLTSLIDDLLAARGSRHGRRTPSVRPTNVVEVVRRHVEERAEDVDVSATLPDVEALVDPADLGRIAADLLDTARTYGGPPIRVEVEADEEAVELSVVDQGSGVPAWFVPNPFDPFSQELVGDLRPTSGLGLGLAICRDLATANGGTLRYDHASASLGGTRFTLRLGRASVAHTAARSTSGDPFRYVAPTETPSRRPTWVSAWSSPVARPWSRCLDGASDQQQGPGPRQRSPGPGDRAQASLPLGWSTKRR